MYRHQGFDPSRQPAYPQGFSGRFMMYHWFAQVHGWTPRQVDELGLDELFWLPVMREASELAAEQLRETSLGSGPAGPFFFIAATKKEPRVARFPNPCPICDTEDEHAEWRDTATDVARFSPATFCPHPAEPGHGTGCCCAGLAEPPWIVRPSSPTLEQRVTALEEAVRKLSPENQRRAAGMYATRRRW